MSAGAAATVMRGLGVDADWVDASIDWHHFALSREQLGSALDALDGTEVGFKRIEAFRRAMLAVTARPPALREAKTYQSRQRYTSAIRELEVALNLVAEPYPDVRLGVAMIAMQQPARRLESSRTLAAFAQQPGPFDAYFEQELIPRLLREHTTEVAVSLTFQQQAPAAFRLAQLLSQRAPDVRRLLGGPLVACWKGVGIATDGAPFVLFDEVLTGSDADLASIAHTAVGRDLLPVRHAGPLSVPWEAAAWDRYLSPMPTVPVALGMGCSWRRCTFCPDHLHPRHRPCELGALAPWLHQIAERFPGGAMLHLTDSALPPEHLARLAQVIADDRLPLSWHGFVRVEAAFAEPDFVQLLARGGCAMLQFGVESGSASMLEQLGKGATPALAGRVLQATASAGIRNHVYLLFGLPNESDEDRGATLQLIEERADDVHAVNPALLNLPKRSPMHRHPEKYGITEIIPFGADTDLSLYDDFRCGAVHPRSEARHWLGHTFFKSKSVRAIQGHLRSPFKANHLCFL